MEEEIQPQNNFYVYVLSIILVAAVGFVSYIYNTNDLLKKGELEKRYVDKSTYDSDIYQLKEKLNSIKPEIKTKIEIKEIEKIVEVEKIVEIEKEKIIYKSNDIKIDKNNFNRIACYDMENGKYNISSTCQEKVVEFLKQNNKSKQFEIISVVDNTEFALLSLMPPEDKIIYKTRVNKLYNLAQVGLAKKRAVEASWLIKNNIGIDANIKITNYEVLSQKGSKGFIIKAYQ